MSGIYNTQTRKWTSFQRHSSKENMLSNLKGLSVVKGKNFIF